MKIDEVLFQQHFGHKECKIKNGFVHTEYNLFTSTGRPSNRFGNINYAALKKDDGCRFGNVTSAQDGTLISLFMICYGVHGRNLIMMVFF